MFWRQLARWSGNLQWKEPEQVWRPLGGGAALAADLE